MRRRKNRSSVLLLVLVTLALALASSPIKADNQSQSEYAIKAALVYNFIRFSQWPPSTCSVDADSLSILVFGPPEVVEAFSLLEGKPFQGRAIQILGTQEAEKIPHCNLLFFAGNDRQEWAHVRTALGESPVMTIGEMPGFLQSGGIINLHLIDGRIHFQINLDQAHSRGLQISSRLLKLASLVILNGKETRR